MIRVCLDTSAYSRFMRGDRLLEERLEEADEILVPVPMLGELHAGFNLGTKRLENIETLGTFLEQPSVRVIPTTASVAERYGEIFRQLRSNGTPIPTNDIWIAAIAFETGSRLVAYDKHFDRVPGLLIEAP